MQGGASLSVYCNLHPPERQRRRRERYVGLSENGPLTAADGKPADFSCPRNHPGLPASLQSHIKEWAANPAAGKAGPRSVRPPDQTSLLWTSASFASPLNSPA